MFLLANVCYGDSSHKTFFEPSAPDLEWVTATIISLMASASSLIFFSGHHSDTHSGLPFLASIVLLCTDAATICL
jgi:hypothetical protein